MKKEFKSILLVLFFSLFLLSCNSEELLEDIATEEAIDENEDEEEVITIEACDFTLNDVQENSTIIINCILDLGGKTVNLPSGITIEYEGGKIINGTLNFSDNSIVDGNLLNQSLIITGSTPQVKDPVFNFDPSRWGIVEGKVTDEVARKNRELLRSLISQSKEMGVTTFKMDAIDAYFKVDEPEGTPEYGAIEIPSDFTLLMSDKTHLRVQPHSFKESALLTVFMSSNVVIKGGNLYGDRDEHNYVSGGDTHEWGFVVLLKASENVVVEGVKINDAGGDGLIVEGLYHAFQPEYIASSNLRITDCIINNSRRNNLSIVDGHDIVIENNTFLNAGANTSLSTGTAPRYAIDIEPVIGSDRNNPQQKVDRIIIRNNTEKGSYSGGFVAYEGDDILFTGNSFESIVDFNYASNVRIVDNPMLGGGIWAGSKDWIGRSTNKNTIISGNNISNTYTGIIVFNQDIKIFDNTITNCVSGIQIDALKDAHIYNNVIESNKEESDGFTILDYADNVLIENNTVTVLRHPMLFDTVNHTPGEEAFVFTLKGNTLTSNNIGLITYTYGINFIENNINHSLRLDGCENIVFDGNDFKTKEYSSINFRFPETDNIQIKNNTVENTEGNGIVFENLGNENKTISIDDNVFNIQKEWNSGMVINDTNGLLVRNNEGSTNKASFIYYRGNNSSFTNNRNPNDENLIYDVEGNNNTIN